MSHGHDEPAHASSTSHGPAELPPVPESRFISPAREDFDRPWPGGLVFWPFVWTGVAALLLLVVRADSSPFEASSSPAGEHSSAAPADHAPAPEGGMRPADAPPR